MNAQDPESLYTTAQTLAARGEMGAAEILLRQATEVASANGSTVYRAGLAALLGIQGRREESVELLTAELEKHPGDSKLLVAYGMTMEAAGEAQEAERLFREAIASEPDYPAALHGLACRLRERGELEEAEKMACKAFARAPEHPGFAMTACEILDECQKPDLAFEVAELAAHYNPDEADLVHRAVEGALARDMPDRAWSLLAESDVDNPWVAGWKATIIDLDGRHEEADQILAETRKVGEKDPTYLFLEACIYNRRGQLEAVTELVDKIFAIDPHHAGAHKLKAEISMETSDVAHALEPLEKAFELSNEAEIGWELVASYYAAGKYRQSLELCQKLRDAADMPATLLPTFSMLCHAALDEPAQAAAFVEQIPPEMAGAAIGEMERGGAGTAAEAALRGLLEQRARTVGEQVSPGAEPEPLKTVQPQEPAAGPATRPSPARSGGSFTVDPRVFAPVHEPPQEDEYEWVEVDEDADEDEDTFDGEFVEEIIIEEPLDILDEDPYAGLGASHAEDDDDWEIVADDEVLGDDEEFEWIEIEEEISDEGAEQAIEDGFDRSR